MSKSRLFILLFPVAGLLLGQLIFWLDYKGLFVRWSSLGSPPYGAQEIISANLYTICVKNNIGESYCQKLAGSTSGEWVSGEMPVYDQYFPISLNYWARNPPGDVISSLELSESGQDLIQKRYVVLRDGSVWSWLHGSTLLGERICLPIYTWAGLIVGSLCSYVFLRLQSRESIKYRE
jgi:hypothetical protein